MRGYGRGWGARASFACAALAFLAALSLGAQQGRLAVQRQGDHLCLVAPHFHFLEGKPLEALRNGAAVPYVFFVSIEGAQGGGRWSHLHERFVVSYDLWEERFTVVRDGPPRRSASRLSAAAAETWCLDSLLPPLSAVPPGKLFVVKLECAVVPDEEPRSGAEGITLSALIDIFSRTRAAAPPHWELLSVPLRVADLKDKPR